MKRDFAKAFAPATVANVGSGFDILGFAISGVGDQVRVRRISEGEVRVLPMRGGLSASAIPLDPLQNTAGMPLVKMREELGIPFGFEIEIEKGIPLGSGLGGSAASAVGAVVAANMLLEEPLSQAELVRFALEGEAVASGSKHADNIAPCLYGGLTLSAPGENPNVVSLPYPKKVFCVVIYPAIRIDTRDARAVVSKELPLKTHVEQSHRLASLVSGFCTGDLNLVRTGLEDVLIEPQRANLIPGFYKVKEAAMNSGALGCSISGAGPSVFALTSDEHQANQVREAMTRAFEATGLPTISYVSPFGSKGAYLT